MRHYPKTLSTYAYLGGALDLISFQQQSRKPIVRVLGNYEILCIQSSIGINDPSEPMQDVLQLMNKPCPLK